MRKAMLLALALFFISGCASRSKLEPLYPGFPGISPKLPALSLRGIGQGETKQAAYLNAWADYCLGLSRLAVIDLSLTRTGREKELLSSLIQLKTAVPSFEKIKVEYGRYEGEIVCQIYTTFRSVSEREELVKGIYEDLKPHIVKWHSDQLEETPEEMDWQRLEAQKRSLNKFRNDHRVISLPQTPLW